MVLLLYLSLCVDIAVAQRQRGRFGGSIGGAHSAKRSPWLLVRREVPLLRCGEGD